MNCAIYARKSEESEERQVQSIDDQLRLVVALLEKEGATPVTIIRESMSAKEPDQREGFVRLISLVEKGAVDTVAAWHPDRLSRNEMDAARICYLVRKGKLNLKFVSYTFDNSPEGLMMLQLALSQSQYYSSKLSKDVLRGLESKIEQGWWPHRAPEGYLNNRDERTIVPDPERFPLVKRAFDIILTGAYTVEEVRRIMNDQWGYRTRKYKKIGGKELTRAAAYRMFSSIFYAGRMERKGQIIEKASHVPMITLDEFVRVQQITGRGSYKKRTFAFNGLMRCRHCGRAVVGSLQHGRHKRGTYVYYRCGNSKCTASSHGAKEEEVEAKVAAKLNDVRWPAWFREIILDEAKRYFQERLGDHEAYAKRHNEMLSGAERRRANLLDMKLDGEIDSATYKAKEAELTAEINTLRSRLVEVQAKFDQAWETVNRVCDYIIWSQRTYALGDAQKKREILAALGAEYRFDNGEVEIVTNPLLPENFGLHKTLRSGSESNKKDSFGKPFHIGAAFESIIKTFDLALEGYVFPLIEYIR